MYNSIQAYIQAVVKNGKIGDVGTGFHTFASLVFVGPWRSVWVPHLTRYLILYIHHILSCQFLVFSYSMSVKFNS